MKLLFMTAFTLYPATVGCAKCEDENTKIADAALAPYIGEIEAADDGVTEAEEAKK